MADILTQLQTCLDQLATQLYSTTCYLSQRHSLLPPNPIPDDPYTLPPTTDSSSSSSTAMPPGPEDTDPSNPRPLHPDPPAIFAASQRELAQDLILKSAQIEYLVSVLPGLGKKEEEQEERIRVLERELRSVEEGRRWKRREMRALVGRLEDVVMGVAESGGVVVNTTKNSDGIGG